MKTIIAVSLIALGLFLSTPSAAQQGDDDCGGKVEVRDCKLYKNNALLCTYTDGDESNTCGISTKITWDLLSDDEKQRQIQKYGTDFIDKLSKGPPGHIDPGLHRILAYVQVANIRFGSFPEVATSAKQRKLQPASLSITATLPPHRDASTSPDDVG